MLPIMVGVAMLWVVSACANWYFGLSLGNADPFRMLFFTTTTSELFSHASLASDLIKSAALFGVFAAFNNSRKLAGAALVLAFMCCTAWSIASAVGFVSLNYSSMTDNRGKTAVEWTQLQSQISRLHERRKLVETARPENVVKAEIESIMRTPGVNGCVAIDGPVTRALCPQLDKLKVEMENAKAGPWLDGRLAELRTELKATPRVTSEDPRADMYAKITGKVSEDMAVWLALFFALMIELLTATGFWAAWTAFGAAMSGEPQEASTAPKAIPQTEPDDPGKRELVETEQPHEAQVFELRKSIQMDAPSMKVREDPHRKIAFSVGAQFPQLAYSEEAELEAEPEIEAVKPPAPTKQPGRVKKAKAKRKKHRLSKHVTEWLCDTTSSEPGYFVASGRCFDNFKQWCSHKGYHEHVSFRLFTGIIKEELGLDDAKRNNGGQTMLPIRLSDPKQWGGFAQQRRKAA